jgi:parallel beta-helix repeat protein
VNRFLAVIFVLIGAQVCLSATIRIPLDQATIQAGINVATTGDTVLVSPGTYTGSIAFNGKRIVVASLSGPIVTILQPSVPTNTIVTFSGGEDTTTVLEGFTIQSGSDNVYITGNASPRIVGNRILYATGRGIFGNSSSGAIIRGNHFEGNGGAFKTYSGTYIVEDNVVIDNHTGENGGGLFCYDCTNSRLVGNIVARNSAAHFGGGIIISVGSGNQVINNTIYGNACGGEGGGGLLLYTTSGCDVRNNIVAYNGGPNGVQQNGGSCVLEYNDVYGNGGSNYSGASAGIGSLSLDPSFVDTAEVVFDLLTGSPCIDAGDPSPAYLDADGTRNDMGAVPLATIANTPLARNIRLSPTSNGYVRSVTPTIGWTYFDTTSSVQAQHQIQVGTDSDWAVAETWDPGPVVSGDSQVVYSGSPLVNNGRYYLRMRVNDGTQWGDWLSVVFVAKVASLLQVPSEFATIQAAISAAVAGDTVLVAPGTYTENLTISGKALFVIGQGGSAVTTLHPASTSTSSVIWSMGGAGGLFEGFTVEGGGSLHTFVISQSSPEIRNNVFRNNIPVGSPNVEVVSCQSASATITRNLFYGNGGIGCVGLRSGSTGTKIINNTFDGNERGFFSIAGGGTALNNIVTNSLGHAVGVISLSDFTLLDYNDLWNNNPNYNVSGIAGTHDFSADPLYVDRAGRNYRLQPLSPCINAGDPDPAYNDPDGSRNDLGGVLTTFTSPSAPELVTPTIALGSPLYNLTPTMVWLAATDPDPGDVVRYRLELSPSPTFAFVFKRDSLTTTSYTMLDSLAFATHYWWRVTAFDAAGLSTTSPVGDFWTWVLGDMDQSNACDIGDLARLVDFLFFGSPINPRFVGDMTGDCLVDISDLSYLVSYLFIDGPAPQKGC